MPPSRRARKKDDPRTRIVEAALVIFATRGSEAASIADVAARAHMSKQALMHHFPTKDLLLTGVYKELARRLREVFLDVVAELMRGRQNYARAIELVGERLAGVPTITRFILFELLGRPRETMEWLRIEAAPWLDLVNGVFGEERARRGAGVRGRRGAGQPQDDIDPDAHLTVLAGSMIAMSALVPRKDPRWWRRVNRALLRVLRVGSQLEGARRRPS